MLATALGGARYTMQPCQGMCLERRANPNRRTIFPEPKLGLQAWVSTLEMAVFYKHNDVARLLLKSRAHVAGGKIFRHAACGHIRQRGTYQTSL